MGQRISSPIWGRRTPRRILLHGLDAAGKTTILYQWKLGGEVTTTIPTIGFNVEEIRFAPYNVMVAWDVGGRDKIRPLWRHYYQDTNCLVWVIDSNDSERLEQTKDELERSCQEDELAGVPLLILCNKQDLPRAITVEEICERLNVSSIRNRRVQVMPVVATTGKGLQEALSCIDWLLKQPPFVDSSQNKEVNMVLPPQKPMYPLTKKEGNETLKHFAVIQNNTECPFAKAAKLWGGTKVAPETSLQDQAKANCLALCRFVYECQQPNSTKLDGFCMELNHPQARSASPREFGECARVFLTALSDLDPQKEFVLRVKYIQARGWRFRFGGVDFFATTFAPCYPITSSRYAFGCGRAFVLLQPETSFLQHALPPDTAHTNWEQPVTVRDQTRVAYQRAGRPYFIPKSTKYAPAEHIVKPLVDNGWEVIPWWEPASSFRTH